MKKKFLLKTVALIITFSLIAIAVPLQAFAETNAAIIASTVSVNPGETVKVSISLENNPGIVSLTLKVNFNTSALTLQKVEDAGALGTTAHKPELTSPYTLVWVNDTATTNYDYNGKIATLTFLVNKSAETGRSYPIELSYNYNNYDIYNKDLTPVKFGLVNGQITISGNHISGDVDGDKKVNINDLVIIAQYVAGWQNLKINEAALDTNGDGVVNLQDVTHFSRYLAGWKNVELN